MYSNELHKFVIGDTRTDGWKSPWRRDTEAWIEAHRVDRRIVTAPQIKARQIRRCEICEAIIRKDNVTGRCYVHKPKAAPSNHRREVVRRCLKNRRARLRVAGFCVDCGKNKAKTKKTLCQGCLDHRSRREMERQVRLARAA